ncbi:MAG: hypothetical protein ACFFAO_03670 [Candidatus Hermodarchaeota archaeon]
MISWILCIILIIWILFNRFRKNRKVVGYPLGIPKGSVRAFIAIIVVAFPFNYLIVGQEIPSVIASAIFILVAFYFETRRTKKEELSQMIHEIKHPEEAEEEEIKIYPLYLPKYSVRILLIVLLASILIINSYGPNVPFEQTNTLVDIFIIIIFYIIGSLARIFLSIGEDKELRIKIKNKLEETPTISDVLMVKYLFEEEPSWWMKTRKNIISCMTLIAIIIALALYTIDWDYEFLIILTYTFTVRSILFLLINIYFGFRD